MMVKMAEHASDRREALALFHDTVSRLAFLIAPLAIALAVLSEPFIISLYTDVYAVRAADLLHVHHGAKRHELAVLVARLEPPHVLGLYAELRFSLRRHLP